MRRKQKTDEDLKQLQDQLRTAIPLLETQLLFARLDVLGKQAMTIWENADTNPTIRTAEDKQAYLDQSIEELDYIDDTRWDQMVSEPQQRYMRVKAFVEQKKALLHLDLAGVLDDLYDLSCDLSHNMIGKQSQKKEQELRRFLME